MNEKTTGGVSPSSFLGVKVGESKTVVVPDEVGMPPEGGDGKPPLSEDAIVIDNLEEVIKKVEAENEEKRLNPSMVADGEAGVNFIDGEPYMVIDDQYVPFKEAEIILQTRKVVREYLKLESLKKVN